MSKRRSTNDTNGRSSKRRKVEQNEEANDVMANTMIIEDPPVFDMATLPSDILGNLIFKYFDFKHWLRSFSLVNKQWYQAAIHSNADKQLFIYRSGNNLHNQFFIAARYRVSTIGLMARVPIVALAGLLNSSPKLHTFINFDRGLYTDPSNAQCNLKFPFIKTVFIHGELLKRFPNATRVQLLEELPKNGTFPNVEELAIQETDNVAAVLKQFPSLKVLHVLSLKDETLTTNPPNVEVRITCMKKNKNWRKHYILNQAWDDSILSALQEHAKICEETKYTVDNPHSSIDCEISLLYRHEEYTFPAIAEYDFIGFSSYSRLRYQAPKPKYCKYLNLDLALDWCIQNKQKEDVVQLLATHSELFGKTMKPSRFAKLLSVVAPSSLRKYFTKEQLADIMKRRDSKGSLAYRFIKMNLDPEDLEVAKNICGPLPNDWPNEHIGKASLLIMAERDMQYNWIKYLINHGAKVEISTLFSSIYYGGRLGGIGFFDKNEVRDIIRLTHSKNAYKSSRDWIFDSDWTCLSTEYQINVIDFLVEELNIDLNKEENKNLGTSFVNYVIWSMKPYPKFQLIEHLWSKHNLDLNRVDSNNRTPLMTAIVGKMPDLAMCLLERGASVNSPKTSLPLCEVIRSDMFDDDIYKYIDLLLAYGADINEFTVDDENNKPIATALMFAAERQPVDVVKYLVMSGAKVDAENDDFCNALHFAVNSDRSEAVEFLAKYIDVNSVNREGLSPLHIAIKSECSLSVVEALLKNGADVNQRKPRSLKTPMMACKDFAILEEILKYNVNVRARDIKGHSLVYYFVANFDADHKFKSKESFLKHIEHLITDKNIAFVIAEAKKIIKRAIKTLSQNALLNNIFALCTSTQYFAEFLIDHVGFDINTQDDQGNVLLSYPMNEETFMYLMTKNPNVNIKNKRPKTPLVVLKECKDAKITQKMLDVLVERSKHSKH